MAWSWKGDSKHRREVIKFWGFGDETKAARDMQMKPKTEDMVEDKTELDNDAARMFRGMAARVNYMGQGRPDLQYAAREVCTEMSKPTVGGMAKLKKVARYLVGVEKGGMEDGGMGIERRTEDRSIRGLRLAQGRG